MEYERGMRRRGSAPVFLLRLRDFLTTSPFDLMRRFSENMDWFFESWSISVMTVWSPSIAISETDEHVKVRAELPGLNENDVRVELTQDELTISGERKREAGGSARRELLVRTVLPLVQAGDSDSRRGTSGERHGDV